MRIVSEATKRLYQKTISQIRKDIGKSIRIHIRPSFENIVDEIDCPTCEFDPLYRRSKDPDCPTCGGTGKVSAANLPIDDLIYTINDCSIVYGPLTDASFRKVPVGRLEYDQVRISMNLDKVLVDKLNPDGNTYFDLAYKVVIAGYDYEVRDIQKVGLVESFSCRVLLSKKE